jgi:hypothetical protein
MELEGESDQTRCLVADIACDHNGLGERS